MSECFRFVHNRTSCGTFTKEDRIVFSKFFTFQEMFTFIIFSSTLFKLNDCNFPLNFMIYFNKIENNIKG